MDKTPSKLFIVLGLFFTSLSAIFIRLSNAPSLVISSYRMLFTVLILLIPTVYNKKVEYKNIELKEFLLCILSGIFLAFHFATWIASINMTSIASSTVLVSLSPIFVALASYFLFKENLNLKSILGISIAILGSIVIAFSDTQTNSLHALKGDLLAFLGSIFVAGYFIIGKNLRKKINTASYVFIVYSVSAIVLFLLCFVTGTSIYPYPIKEFVIFFLLAFFCSVLGHTLYNWMMQFVPATFISTSTLGEPVFASIMAFMFFNEIPSTLTIIGGIVIIFGIYFYIKHQKSESIK